MKNKGLKIFGGFLAVVVAGFFIVTLTLDGILKSGIEENATELLQTRVTVDNVSVSPFNGAGSIEGFTVDNPDTFSEKEAIRIEEASIQIEIGTLFSDNIVVDDITIKSPQLYFEQKGLGVNLKTLKDNMDLSADGSSETGLIIEHLLIENGKVTVKTDIEEERTASAQLDSFELNNIGAEGSNTVRQSVGEIMEPLLEEAIAEAIKGGVTDQLKNQVNKLLGD